MLLLLEMEITESVRAKTTLLVFFPSLGANDLAFRFRFAISSMKMQIRRE